MLGSLVLGLVTRYRAHNNVLVLEVQERRRGEEWVEGIWRWRWRWRWRGLGGPVRIRRFPPRSPSIPDTDSRIHSLPRLGFPTRNLPPHPHFFLATRHASRHPTLLLPPFHSLFSAFRAFCPSSPKFDPYLHARVLLTVYLYIRSADVRAL